MMPLFPCFTGNSISFAAILTDKNRDLGIVVEPRDSRTSLAHGVRHRHTQIDNSAYTLERALNALSRSHLLVLTSHSYAHSQPFGIPPSFHSISALLLDRRLE